MGVAMRLSFDCFISLKTLLVAAASSRRSATTVVSGSIDSLECVLLGKISSCKSLYGFAERRCFVPNVVSSVNVLILCQVLELPSRRRLSSSARRSASLTRFRENPVVVLITHCPNWSSPMFSSYYDFCISTLNHAVIASPCNTGSYCTLHSFDQSDCNCMYMSAYFKPTQSTYPTTTHQ